MGAPQYWGSWKGRIIKAITVDNILSENEIFLVSGLSQEEFVTALNELIEVHVVSRKKGDKLWVNSKDLYREYKEFHNEQRVNLTRWFTEYTKNLNLSPSTHYYLEDRDLEDLSIKLLGQASEEIIVANPFIDRCHLSNALMDAGQKRIPIILLTRPISESEFNVEKKFYYHQELLKKGVAVYYNNVVHAKIIVVDKSVAITSSMNLTSSSSGGASWEAGIVTTEEWIINEAIKSIHKKIMG
jgi:phosphatidylserine/phosphatidylglycerophosphate/cardiolipin synthase-like enzyme